MCAEASDSHRFRRWFVQSMNVHNRVRDRVREPEPFHHPRHFSSEWKHGASAAKDDSSVTVDQPISSPESQSIVYVGNEKPSSGRIPLRMDVGINITGNPQSKLKRADSFSPKRAAPILYNHHNPSAVEDASIPHLSTDWDEDERPVSANLTEDDIPVHWGQVEKKIVLAQEGEGEDAKVAAKLERLAQRIQKFSDEVDDFVDQTHCRARG